AGAGGGPGGGALTNSGAWSCFGPSSPLAMDCLDYVLAEDVGRVDQIARRELDLAVRRRRRLLEPRHRDSHDVHVLVCHRQVIEVGGACAGLVVEPVFAADAQALALFLQGEIHWLAVEITCPDGQAFLLHFDRALGRHHTYKAILPLDALNEI